MLCSNQLSYIAIFFCITFVGVAGRIMLITDPTVNSFLHYFSENVTVCLLNNHFVDKASKKQARI
ncbi:hypothetical protein DYB39_05270 [Providencia rettgeri]|nr:hypothetical protein AM461_08870 [Providencia rettgeri]RFT12537.1 hypothetical protein DYB39_05270 [Providencia rettgeri]